MSKLGRRTFLKLASATATAGVLYKLGLVELDSLDVRRLPSFFAPVSIPLEAA